MGSRRTTLPTDLETLSAPVEFHGGDRSTDVVQQRITVNGTWWAANLAARGLPGGPLLSEHGAAADASLTRADVWAHAAAAAEDDTAALALLWHTLAWGSGRRVRNETRRMDAVMADRARAARLLRTAAALARHSPTEAFETLHPGGRGAIARLGPAFGTKFLYFAGAGDPGHPCLILDARVATALRGLGWASLGTRGGWGAATYTRYCRLLSRWASELSCGGPPVAGDQIEKWLFDRGRPKT